MLAADGQGGTLSARYEAGSDFLNPAGQIQGGMLSAMLDDLCAALVDAGLPPGHGVATLNLNVSFLAPARPGVLLGHSKRVGGGRSIWYVEAALEQDGVEVARASACCKVFALKG